VVDLRGLTAPGVNRHHKVIELAIGEGELGQTFADQVLPKSAIPFGICYHFLSLMSGISFSTAQKTCLTAISWSEAGWPRGGRLKKGGLALSPQRAV
jgi:hypothetical protein